jgi:hypothetical protein
MALIYNFFRPFLTVSECMRPAFLPWQILSYALASVLSLSLCAFAQNPVGNYRPDACDAYEKVTVPPADLPTDADRKALADCKSEDFYFGFEHEPDFAKARACAFLEQEGKKQLVFGGTGVLTMIYANGKGAARNLDLALRFACQSDWGAEESLRRFNHLVELKERKWAGDNFSLCDDVTGGEMSKACASVEAKVGDSKRSGKLAAIVAGWSAEQKQAFAELQKSEDEFVEARADNEVDLSGTAHAEYQYEEQQTLREEFSNSLQEFEAGKLPGGSADDFKQADAELASLFKSIDGQADNAELYGTVTPVGVRRVEKVWLRYREAWVRFGKVKYPDVSADSWRVWLTRRRIEMLKEFGS